MGNLLSPLFVELEIGLIFGLGDVSRNVAKHSRAPLEINLSKVAAADHGDARRFEESGERSMALGTCRSPEDHLDVTEITLRLKFDGRCNRIQLPNQRRLMP